MRVERVVEARDYVFLCHLIDIDHQVAARDKVNLGKGGVGQHVVTGKDAHAS